LLRLSVLDERAHVDGHPTVAPKSHVVRLDLPAHRVRRDALDRPAVPVDGVDPAFAEVTHEAPLDRVGRPPLAPDRKLGHESARQPALLLRPAAPSTL